jgi:hypothetical protein
MVAAGITRKELVKPDKAGVAPTITPVELPSAHSFD